MNNFTINRLFPNVDPGTISFVQVFSEFHEGITITDQRGVILYMNDSQARIDDFNAEDSIGKRVTDLYRVDEGFSPTMSCLRTGKTISNLACYYRTHLGRVVNSIHNVYPITAARNIIGAICLTTDYSNIEHTFDTVIKSQPPISVPTYGVTNSANINKAKNNGTRYTFDDIIGNSPDLLNAVKSAKLASESASPILIFGETGTGKELFAQSIHNSSSRRNAPYLAINCATIPENLLEGMLFGTTAGAFTGAIDKSGMLEKANGGTLLLDEVNSMPLSLQAKLLRFLQERKVRRIGSMKEVDVDLKIISSINVPPHQAIESGTLRSDLFYRLAVVFIQIPNLVERKYDINPLITHFLGRKNRQLSKHVNGIAMDVLDLFSSYHWPGNVRELEHVIEGAMNFVGTENIIKMRHLSVPLSAKPLAESAIQTRKTSSFPAISQIRMSHPLFASTGCVGSKTLAEGKKAYEVAAIVSALQDTRGNAAKAARKLGISPQSMNYRLRRYKINKGDFTTD